MKTQSIFTSTNSYQGKEQKVVFVCSVGLLRSPTAARIAAKYRINARSCGSDISLALIPISESLINWADKVIFINEKNYNQTLKNFSSDEFITKNLINKSSIWNIEDNYDYMEKALIKELKVYFERDFKNV